MRIDWQRIVLNLRQAGCSVSEIHRRAHMDERTVQRFARGELQEPRWSQGIALLDLHHRWCPERHKVDALAA